MNMLCVGADNPVRVLVRNYPDEDVVVTVTSGTISSAGEGDYIIKPEEPGRLKVNSISESEWRSEDGW